jgi:carbamoyl-phosphate synthase large subunit
MANIGLDVPAQPPPHDRRGAGSRWRDIGLPASSAPAFTLGGTAAASPTTGRVRGDRPRGLDLSPDHRGADRGESVLGWKEYELEVMRDKADNVVIICSIENIDPMGVHTGDSITVAPAQTLTDKEYQRMRDASIAIIREIGVETGGSNIQFASTRRPGAWS